MSAGGCVLSRQKGFLSRLATGLGLVGAALIAFVLASMFGLADFLGPETNLPAIGILLAPMMGLAGLVVALASRRHEGSDGWEWPLQINGAVMAVAALLLVLAVI
jgi:hypothetical protein